jgi:hypothetical protein
MTQFGYNPEAVWRAVAGEGVNPDAAAGSENRQVPWTWLPVRVAADLWREYLRKYALDELFTLPQEADSPIAPENRRTAYDRIVEMVKNRMVNPQVEALDEFGRPLGRLEPSKEYALLAERGIQVLSAGVRNLRFPRVVEGTILEQWQATWMERAQSEAREIDRLQMQVKGMGQELALREFATAASQSLGRELLQKPSGGEFGLRQTLERLLDGTLRLTIHEADLQPRLTNQRGLLVEMIEWVRKQTGKTS